MYESDAKMSKSLKSGSGSGIQIPQAVTAVSPRATLRRALIAKARETLEDGAIRAAEYLAQAARGDAPAKRERIDAAKTLLDRVGIVPPERRSDDPEKDVTEMSGGELHALLSQLEGELANRAKPVSVASATQEPGQPTGIFD